MDNGPSFILVQVEKEVCFTEGKNIEALEGNTHSVWHYEYFTSLIKYDQCAEQRTGVKYF